MAERFQPLVEILMGSLRQAFFSMPLPWVMAFVAWLLAMAAVATGL